MKERKKYRGIERGKHVAYQIPSNTYNKLSTFTAKRVFALANSIFMAFSFVACTGQEDIQNKMINKPSSSITGPTIDDNKPKIDVGNIDLEYSDLLEKLNQKLAKRDFSELANSFFREYLTNVYDNYSDWQSVYKDLPSVSQYIQDRIINTIDNINSITMLDSESPEAEDLLEQGEAMAFTDSDFGITIIYTNPEKATEDEHQQDVESFGHEVAGHCATKNVFDDKYYDNDPIVRYWWTEGEATFHSELMNKLSALKTSTWSITNSKGDKTLEFGKYSGIGYLVDVYAYQNCIYFAGYDTVEKVGNEADVSIVREEIAKRYGKEFSDKLWDTMNRWYAKYLDNWQSDEAYDLSIELQSLIFEAMKHDINDLNVKNPDQVKKFMDVYRNYKLKIMPQAFDEDYNLCTNQVFNTDELDDLLINKVVESGAVSFSTNPKLNQMAIKSMLYADNEIVNGNNGIVYLPGNIKNTQYNFMEYKNDQGKPEGYLLMTYKEGPDKPAVLIGVTFDENEILDISVDNGRYEEHNQENVEEVEEEIEIG